MADDVIDTVRGEDGHYLSVPMGGLPTAAAPDPQIVAFIQRMIDASFARHDMRHGHLSEPDGMRLLARLTTKTS